MRKAVIITILLFIILSLSAQDSLLIRDRRLNEVSGIAGGRRNPSLFYMLNDSGGKPEVYALNAKGKVVATLALRGASNRDWEDIALGQGPSSATPYIYVGDIGDNNARHPEVYLFRFEEPRLNFTGKSHKEQRLTISPVQKLTIVYADGPKDCESLFLDPLNGDIYLISKREASVGLYKVSAPLDTLKANVAHRVLSLGFPLAVAADISPGRDKILVKTYNDIYCWQVLPHEAIDTALSRPPVRLPYQPEFQGEGVCWSAAAESYLTISEQADKQPLYLYTYPYKPPSGLPKSP